MEELDLDFSIIDELEKNRQSAEAKRTSDIIKAQELEGALSPEEAALANFAKVRSDYFKNAEWDDIIKGIKGIVPKEYDFKADIDDPEKFRTWWEGMSGAEHNALKKVLDSKMGEGTYSDLANAMPVRFTKMDREEVLSHPIGVPVLDQIASGAIKIFTPNQAKAIRAGEDYTGGEMAEDLIKDAAYMIPVGGAVTGARVGAAAGGRLGATELGKALGAFIGGTAGNAVVPTGVELWDAYKEGRPVSGQNILIGTTVNQMAPFILKGLAARFGKDKAAAIMKAMTSGKELPKAEQAAVEELVREIQAGKPIERIEQQMKNATTYSAEAAKLNTEGAKMMPTSKKMYEITDPKTGKKQLVADPESTLGYKFEMPEVNVSPTQQAALDVQYARTYAKVPDVKTAKEMYKNTGVGRSTHMSFETWYNMLKDATEKHNAMVRHNLIGDVAGDALESYATNRFGDSDFVQNRAKRQASYFDLFNVGE